MNAQDLKEIEIETPETLIWTTDRKLKSTDFRGAVDRSSSKKALTGANIIIVPYAFKNGAYQYRVLAKFHKDISWLNTDNSQIIKHEQLHFDIAELYARKMRRDIHRIHKDSGQVSQSDYRRIHKSLFTSYVHFQRRYDAQTGHSTDLEEQDRWEEIVAEELEKLEAYNLDL